MQTNPDPSLPAGNKVAAPAKKKSAKGTVATPANSNVEAAAEELGKLNVKAEPRPKSKQIDVVEAYGNAKRDKKSASFVVVGKSRHVPTTRPHP
ncbi:hypothetical protein IMZ48_29710 [Candidatus Bathyarchaeota archaeon]|nr:hypothetical protein [Candidatus Bathyarchaeota archaeon]